MNALHTQYLELEAQLQKLNDQKELLRSQILAQLVAEGKQPLKTDFGTFSVVEYEVWEYSQSLQDAEKKANDEIKAKKQEIADKKEWARVHGKATHLDTKESLRFTAKK